MYKMVASPQPLSHREGSKMRDTPYLKCKKRGKRRAKKCLFSSFGLCLDIVAESLKNHYKILGKGLLI
ncbi:hypothetical protein HMPREF0661_09635 [Prevotella melaninogenica DNF00666]|uniref:Uncharacterized protein n=1 Tax=Prevotella melaninogenica DNF00666 TaxID=1401073 RepID=A0A096AEK5_9BACT|nr:hypothetical protein HMPREF0661_09635 [Prevotella melaninogenica DNF00666]